MPRSSLRRHTVSPPTWLAIALGAAAVLSLSAPGGAWARHTCVVADNGSGTTSFPNRCADGYHTAANVACLIDGFAAGTHVLCRYELKDIMVSSELPGGSLGGQEHDASGVLWIDMVGYGGLAGYLRRLAIPVVFQVHSAPRALGSPLQSFDADLFQFQGQIPPGDPDFDLLRITGGSNFGLPSPGHTTLSLRSDGHWQVDSFFDITYRVDFVGAPGGPFAGNSGSTTSSARFRDGEPHLPLCQAPDIGLTADVPAPCPRGYASHPHADLAVDGMPVGQPAVGTLTLANVQIVNEVPGGQFGGSIADITGDMLMAGFYDQTGLPTKTMVVPVAGVVEVGRRFPGQPLQGAPMELMQLQGQIPPGDPDFDLLRITAGSNFGLPSPGHTTLTQLPGGNWAVDSFFDITYRIDFVGAPGGAFAGMSGSTTAAAQLNSGLTLGPSCTAPDVGGTAEFPVQCPGGYQSGPNPVLALNGLPPGSPLLARLVLHGLSSVEAPGGTLDGDTQSFSGTLDLEIVGFGFFAGYTRMISMPVNGTSDTAPRTPGDDPQNFANDMQTVGGSLPPGDPDFDLLRITGGTAFGMPSPGHTTLSRLPGGDWAVDSFFDITYRIDFIGAPGSPFAGMSGSTTSVARITAGPQELISTPEPGRSELRVGSAYPNPASLLSAVAFTLPAERAVRVVIRDVAGRSVRVLADRPMPAGDHLLSWDGRDEAGRVAASGVYFFELRLGEDRISRRVVIVP